MNPTPTSTSGNANMVSRMSRALPYRATSAPTNCMVTSAAAPKTVDTRPSWPVLRWWSTFSDGTRTR